MLRFPARSFFVLLQVSQPGPVCVSPVGLWAVVSAAALRQQAQAFFVRRYLQADTRTGSRIPQYPPQHRPAATAPATWNVLHRKPVVAHSVHIEYCGLSGLPLAAGLWLAALRCLYVYQPSPVQPLLPVWERGALSWICGSFCFPCQVDGSVAPAGVPSTGAPG